MPSVTPVSCIATVKFSREDLQEIVDKKVKELTGKRKKGKWITNSDLPDNLICSCCNAEYDMWYWEYSEMHYCPNCGAEMES